MALNYATINDATEKIDKTVGEIDKLKEMLDEDLLQITGNDFSNIIEKLDTAKTELEENNKQTFINTGNSMKRMEEAVKGGSN